MITVATPADRPAVVRMLVAAFVTDPFLRLAFPDDAEYPAGAEAFFGHLFDQRVGHGTVWIADGGTAAALWEPPGITLKPELRLDEPARSRMRAYDDAVHHALPAEPFFYLGVLGTHPDHQGRGHGRAVMAAGLEEAARQNLPAYLETTNPGNVALYERAGWRVTAELDSPLPVWVMKQ
ncbi:GNAT family N-acetyltransferase [Kineosporia succinea]|uniref:Ribosomal protein S18 acetylase RimI-like enzyme n=1 Tax=Kineosporia succinea TaxID=84632 RepID=A0ABT9P536_9ACTN|nr:GNAT family N-acetyltransferase [Kineosporia succinea]MDP9827811.1 ribosomal protein S18 acetylase RimI-like enzyme [Kineosporia succinea]